MPEPTTNPLLKRLSELTPPGSRMWVVSSLAWLGLMLMQYPSIERAISKNG